jgi:hypothetical protein
LPAEDYKIEIPEDAASKKEEPILDARASESEKVNESL